MEKTTADPTPEQVAAASDIVERCTGENRLGSREQTERAGIDPETINAAINIVLDTISPLQAAMLSTEPGIGLMLGVTLACTAIDS